MIIRVRGSDLYIFFDFLRLCHFKIEHNKFCMHFTMVRAININIKQSRCKLYSLERRKWQFNNMQMHT